ncbi:Phosphate transport system permease protein PstA [Pirellulimonas nuda]|uniref:Phosphate transport system permease protein PstA n=1 Tax=Pirellulimonas nuda TaxID=2528009 RepID=A0A518D7K3_9BACT|nr:phosphate ABC transporter permease PstA [Pirellulimonas nuda]QDU87464.1 Phosphate transport system permease protein PstA [Pirellulimonas nuda]
MPSPETINDDSWRIDSRTRRRYFWSNVFSALCLLSMVTAVLVLVGLLAAVVYNGAPALRWGLLTDLPSRKPEAAGIYPALLGSLWLIALTALFSVPLGVGAAIYLEEYAAATRWRKLVQVNIANLAGVPSIVYGLLGLALFVRYIAKFDLGGRVWMVGLNLDRVILAGALTLTLVVLPIVILATQEALRAVPNSIRQGSYALGATRWQTVWRQVLPAATPGIMTGVILAVARALGEAAPLVAVGAVGFINQAPSGPMSKFTAMPLQIFNWAARPQEEFHAVASAAILVLVGVLIIMNAGAVWVRYHYGKRIRW